MDHLAAMRVYVAVVEAQGFSAASRELSMPLATVSRKLAELERHLGAQLLVRTTRQITVTDSGQRYYEDVRRILEDIGDAERQVAGEYRIPKGRLTITAPTLFGRLLVLPVVVDFMKRHADIKVQLHFSNTVVDLLEEQIDLAVRVGDLADSSMIAIEAGTIRQLICASPGYLARQPRPVTPSDLAGHHCVTYPTAGQPPTWRFKRPSGKIQRVAVRTALTLNSIEGHVQSALLDAGLAQLYAYQAAPHVVDGSLEILLAPFEVDPAPVNLVYPQSERVPRKLRAFIDFALPRLRQDLARIAAHCARSCSSASG